MGPEKILLKTSKNCEKLERIMNKAPKLKPQLTVRDDYQMQVFLP
jgi:hypothetical protein